MSIGGTYTYLECSSNSQACKNTLFEYRIRCLQRPAYNERDNNSPFPAEKVAKGKSYVAGYSVTF